MRQVLQARQSGQTVVRTVPRPACPPGGVLVHNAFSVISSGTERARVQLSQKSLIGKARERPDLVRAVWERARRDGMRATMQVVQHRLAEETPVGYSCAGTVVEVGEHARGLMPGDVVACAGGTANHAEFVVVPANLCARVPTGVSLQSASVTTIAAIALHAVRLADAQLGSRVAVIGCGLVGQIALRLLRAAGAETFAVDIDPDRTRRARAAGADHGFGVDATTAEQIRARTAVGVDAVIVAAATQRNEPLLLACEIARDRGEVVLVGAVPIEFPRAALYDKELRFRVSRSYGPGRYDAEYEERGLDYPIGYVRWTEQRNMQTVLDLQARGLLSLEDLIEVVPVMQAVDAYARLTDGPGAQPKGALVLSYGGADGPAPSPSLETAPSAATAPSIASPSVTAGAHNGTGVASAGENGAALPARSLPVLKVGTGRTPVRVGLIGPGGFAGRALIPALTAAGADLTIVGGGSGPSAAAATRSGAFRATAPDAAAVIADPQVDAVVICTRHADHAQLTVDALHAGKHVFCEKPLALTTEERDMVIEAAEAASGVLMVGFNRRFSGLLREMRTFLAAPGSPMTLAYRVSAGALDADHWVHDLAQGGGRALGEGCHFVDSMSFLASSPVLEVHTYGRGPAATPVQAYDNLVVSLTFADRSVASLVYVADGSPSLPKERLEGFCAERTAVLDDYSRLELHDGGRHHGHRARGQDKGHREEIIEFLEAVRTGRPALALDEIDNVTLATLALVESLRTGRPVRVTD